MSSTKDEAATRPGGQAFAESPGLDCLQEGDLTTGLQSGPDEKTHAKECIAGLLCRRESCAAVSLINRAELRTARLAGAPLASAEPARISSDHDERSCSAYRST